MNEPSGRDSETERANERPLSSSSSEGQCGESRINKFPFIIISPLLSLKMGKWFLLRPTDRPTNHIYSLSLFDDDADNDEVVITAAAAARSEPILTPGRSQRGAPYTGAISINRPCKLWPLGVATYQSTRPFNQPKLPHTWQGQ